ncbi:hypothetical protein SDC9_146256 [bioreactor metagenome]|uniref:Uncharacterized protein n=1 Tax=bioreactor metagenome TaxID=1076179 RepID=A0A645EBK7_9ZZZZ
MVALALVITVSEVTPTRTSSPRYTAYEGATVRPAIPTVKPPRAPTRTIIRGRLREAAIRAAPSVPTPIRVPIRPYSAGPTWNTWVAISALVTWKLSPKVPSMNTMNITSRMSGRRRTYARPSRTEPRPLVRGARCRSAGSIATRAIRVAA